MAIQEAILLLVSIWLLKAECSTIVPKPTGKVASSEQENPSEETIAKLLHDCGGDSVVKISEKSHRKSDCCRKVMTLYCLLDSRNPHSILAMSRIGSGRCIHYLLNHYDCGFGYSDQFGGTMKCLACLDDVRKKIGKEKLVEMKPCCIKQHISKCMKNNFVMEVDLDCDSLIEKDSKCKDCASDYAAVIFKNPESGVRFEFLYIVASIIGMGVILGLAYRFIPNNPNCNSERPRLRKKLLEKTLKQKQKGDK